MLPPQNVRALSLNPYAVTPAENLQNLYQLRTHFLSIKVPSCFNQQPTGNAPIIAPVPTVHNLIKTPDSQEESKSNFANASKASPKVERQPLQRIASGTTMDFDRETDQKSQVNLNEKIQSPCLDSVKQMENNQSYAAASSGALLSQPTSPISTKGNVKPQSIRLNLTKKQIQELLEGRQMRRQKKVVSKITACEHVTSKYYSKGMCKNCYHRFGRVKLATKCQHSHRKLYARQVCKGCYLKLFNSGVTSRETGNQINKKYQK